MNVYIMYRYIYIYTLKQETVPFVEASFRLYQSTYSANGACMDPQDETPLQLPRSSFKCQAPCTREAHEIFLNLLEYFRLLKFIVRVHVYKYIHTDRHTSAYIHICKHDYTDTYTNTGMHTYEYVYVYTCVYIFVCMCVYVCMYVSMHACMHVWNVM